MVRKNQPGWGMGELLKKRRKELKLSLPSLKVRSGVHTSVTSHIEREERRATAEMLIRLAEPLGFSSIELLILAGYLKEGDLFEWLARVVKARVTTPPLKTIYSEGRGLRF